MGDAGSKVTGDPTRRRRMARKRRTCPPSSADVVTNAHTGLVTIIIEKETTNKDGRNVWLIADPRWGTPVQKLQGTQREDAGWPENVGHVQIFPYAGFVWLLV